ncbi:MAG TPA: DPP IV N-terminal domain-containing protein, partial [Vicinamibacterales bacterium]|nr:DPP IV N-terminal domain-containing protein [Vicinamibacterales bacterium]
RLSNRMNKNVVRASVAIAAMLAALRAPLDAQDRLKTMPGYEQFQKVSGQIPGSVKLAALVVHWKDDGSSFEYAWNGKQYRYDVATRQAVVTGDAPEAIAGRGRGGRGGQQPARGRQFDSAESPDKQVKAFYKDRNVWLSGADGGSPVAITTDGNENDRVKYGTASWVYGEELAQRSAMWWSPDSRKLAYYRFDEKLVPDFYLQMNQTQVQDTLDVEAYPKPGKPNPVVDVFVYDRSTKNRVRLDVRDGRPFDNTAIGHYVYNVSWSPDGREILLDRTNRKQNVLELAACSPESGQCRVVVHEEWPTGWIENRPEMRFLEDDHRFIWESQRSGWKNFYLYDLAGKLITPITNQTTHEAESIVLVDEPHNVLFYTARDGDNYMKLQLHRVDLDGRNDMRLTDPAFMHTLTASPDGQYFVDVAQSHDTPPVTRLLDRDGKVVAELARSDTTKFDQLGLKKVEMFTYTAGDGRTALHGLIEFPSTFDPAKQYPALASVYGGPASAAVSERFTLPSPMTEYGFLVLTLDSRAAAGMGKRTLDDIYLKLGQVEMDDMAEGVKALWSRPYFDRARVGIHGSSYGGYSSAMELLRHPDVFAAASAASPPTDWRNYDTIYTERYMWIPEENKSGYDAGSAMTYAGNLKGRLLIYYGTADNNVHPSNSLQLIKALQQAGKSFEVQVGPDQGHSNVNPQRMMEFFIDALVLHAQAAPPVMTPAGAR